jgi:enamine deaminase RidA (YjgF/YER057c/UK114 family)
MLPVTGQQAMSACRAYVSASDLHETLLERSDLTELRIAARCQAGESPAQLLARVAQHVTGQGAVIVEQTVFAPAAAMPDAGAALNDLDAGLTWPITWLDAPAEHPDLWGTTVLAVGGTNVRPLLLDGRVVGSAWKDGYAQHCALGDLRAEDTELIPAEQTRIVLSQMQAALGQAGLEMNDIYRTWYWNNDILGWYDDFNAVRTEVYAACGGLTGERRPASTGIGAANARGAALTVGLLAARAPDDRVSICTVESPLQSSAEDYGSSFSRALEYSTPEHRVLHISGTASIDMEGLTTCLEDVEGQLETTMDVVGAILEARRMDWRDVACGMAYVRNAEDAPLWTSYCREHGLTDLPVILTNNVVCRESLLFELELKALALK